jgi:hypothetical protein
MTVRLLPLLQPRKPGYLLSLPSQSVFGREVESLACEVAAFIPQLHKDELLFSLPEIPKYRVIKEQKNDSIQTSKAM